VVAGYVSNPIRAARACAALLPAAALAQAPAAYPNKPLRLIVPFSPGGANE
jgi:tripartite-type tricarboxylate transporter receptor subunit TctC